MCTSHRNYHQKKRFKGQACCLLEGLGFAYGTGPLDGTTSHQKIWYIETHLLVEAAEKEEKKKIYGEEREIFPCILSWLSISYCNRCFSSFSQIAWVLFMM